MALAHAHAHCTSCFSVKCDRPGGCPVEICPNGCGTYFHLCKLDEHTRHTCWAAVVPCLNSLYGCEVVLPRAKLAQHLQHCPASILMCRFSCEKVESSHERLGRLRERVIVTPGDRYDEMRYELRYFCFPCSVIVRRDEFSKRKTSSVQHIRHFVDGHPMLAHGRNVQSTQLPRSSSLNSDQGAIGLELPVQKDTISGQCASRLALQDDQDEKSYDPLSCLPVEILMKICQYLDSLSLWNLSQVNRHIRQVCFHLAKRRGIVYYVWQKKEDTKEWKQGPKHWSFSEVFQEGPIWFPWHTLHPESVPQMYDHSIATPYELPRKTEELLSYCGGCPWNPDWFNTGESWGY